MRISLSATAFAVALGLSFLASGPLTSGAAAMPASPQLKVAPVAEPVACRMVTTRVRLPDGRVRVRTVRRCGVPAWQTERWRARHHRPHRREGVHIRIN